MTARILIVLACLFSTAAAATGQPAPSTLGQGVVVESVGPRWSGASKAGLQPGDVIFAWALPETEPAGTHAVATLADWYVAEAEHGLRAAGVVVSVRRTDQLTTARLAGGAWTLGVAPLFDGARLTEHQAATEQSARGEPAEAAAAWRRLAEGATQDPDATLAAWFWLKAANAEMAARNAVGAVAAYGAARASARERGQPLVEREALDGLARAHQASQQPVAAEAALSDAVALLQAERPNSPALVRTLNGLAAAQREFGRLDDSERTYQRALELVRVVAPESIAEVASLGGLSVTLRRRGDRAGAERLLAEASRVLEHFPDHPDRIANAGNRGILLAEQGRLAEAERELRRAEALDRARGTAADTLAQAHHGNLGVIAAQRGDLARAETYARSFLDAAERSSMSPMNRITGLTNLAVIVSERGDRERALALFEEIHTLAARAAPGSAALADALGNLGTARARTGDDAGSDVAYEEALRIRRTTSPDAPAVAAILWSLAANAERRGDLDVAAGLATDALAHIDRTGSAGLPSARALHVAARIALARGRTSDAREHQTRGLAIARELAPGSRVEVVALATLARIDTADRQLPAAAARYAEAVDALAAQVRRLGAPLDLEADFVDDVDVQRPYVDTLLALNRDVDALDAVERFRARAVLDRLATRDLTFGRTDEAGTLARERRSLATAYDGALAQIARLPADAPASQVQPLRARLAELRERQSLAASNLRRVDAEFAERLAPSPVSAAALRAGLPPGTLALVYHLGATRPTVFAVSHDTLRVAALGEPAARLATRVEAWRRLVDRGRSGPRPDPELDREARALFDALLAPVADDIARATRIVIVPDGVLHGLSFAALRRGDTEGPDAYVAAWKPTAVAPSLTALAQLAARPARALASRTATIVGDVRFGDAAAAGASGDGRVRGDAIEGLVPLPGTRREAEDVARTFPARSTLLLGDAASERAIKRVARDTSVLHLATHGLVNERAPLDSALVLAAPGAEDDDNGLLQAWEIFDQVRVDADLVVLSACDTGLGRTFAGEGLLGLTRAFQFAGARAVAASLWKAPDEATATLMAAFYAELARGSAVDVALARAEQQLLTRPETAHPFYWAAFIIDGDTRP